MAFNVQKMYFDTQIFKNLHTVGGGHPPTPFPRSVTSLPVENPGYASDHYVCSLHFPLAVILV